MKGVNANGEHNFLELILDISCYILKHSIFSLYHTLLALHNTIVVEVTRVVRSNFCAPR